MHSQNFPLFAQYLVKKLSGRTVFAFASLEAAEACGDALEDGPNCGIFWVDTLSPTRFICPTINDQADSAVITHLLDESSTHVK